MHFQTYTRTLLADMYTPVGVYLSLRGAYPQSVLMESSDYHARDNARSFVAVCPIGSFAVAHGDVICRYPDGQKTVTPLGPEARGHATDTIARLMADYLAQIHVQGEGADHCGLYGYTASNAVSYFEPVPVTDTTAPSHDAPDILYLLYRDLIVIDHYSCRMQIITLIDEQKESAADASQRIDTLCQRLRQPAGCYDFQPQGDVSTTLTDEQHKQNIRQCIRHCERGDVFQIVVSRRFVQHYTGDDFQLYRTLRSVNPSPYLFYFDFGGFRIFGSSPETHCRIEGDKAYIDPIAGTVPRTGDTEQDACNAQYLRDDPKENAEHVMLVDLARNDLSRACYHVQVDFFKDMQYYSHVIHLVSRVSGTLMSSTPEDKIRAFFHTFPAGTLSGAPKVRAMQIISSLEPHCRGAYGGCIGRIGLNGDLNQAIVIRTFVSRCGELWFQAGSGVVAASDTDYELRECSHKLQALAQSITLAPNI